MPDDHILLPLSTGRKIGIPLPTQNPDGAARRDRKVSGNVPAGVDKAGLPSGAIQKQDALQKAGWTAASGSSNDRVAIDVEIHIAHDGLACGPAGGNVIK